MICKRKYSRWRRWENLKFRVPMYSLLLNVLGNVKKKPNTKFNVTWPYPTTFHWAGIIDKVYTAQIWAKGRYANVLLINIFTLLKEHFIYFIYIGVVWGEGILSWSDLATQSNCSLEIWCRLVIVARPLGRCYFQFLKIKHVNKYMIKHSI